MMMSKEECRSYINDRKSFLNLACICRKLDIPQPHVSMFLKAPYHNHYLSVEKANMLVEFIQQIGN